MLETRRANFETGKDNMNVVPLSAETEEAMIFAFESATDNKDVLRACIINVAEVRELVFHIVAFATYEFVTRPDVIDDNDSQLDCEFNLDFAYSNSRNLGIYYKALRMLASEGMYEAQMYLSVANELLNEIVARHYHK